MSRRIPKGGWKRSYIYFLVDPRDDKPYYVGQSVEPKNRFADHLREVKTAPVKYHPKNLWIKELLLLELKPKLRIVETVGFEGVVKEVNQNKIDTRERYWIRKLRKEGYDLYNLTEGGQVFFPELETRIKQANAKITKFAKIRMDQEMEAYRLFLDSGGIIVPQIDGRTLPKSEEAIAKIKAARAKQIFSKESREKATKALKGQKRTEDQKEVYKTAAQKRIEEKGMNKDLYSPELNKSRSESMKKKWDNGEIVRTMQTGEKKKEADRKRSESMRGKNTGTNLKAQEANRINGLIQMFWNDIAEIESLSPEVLVPGGKRFWFKETGQNKRFESVEEGVEFMLERDIS